MPTEMRPLLTTLGLLAALALASGCGGEDSDTATTAAEPPPAPSATEPTAATTAPEPAGSGEGGPEDQNGSGSGDQGGQELTAPPSGGLAEKAKPDTKGFEVPPGGDDSIQTFGSEPEETEEEEILAAMGTFLRALANKDYPAICEGISDANRAQLEKLMELKKETGGCPTFLEKLLVGPNSEARAAAEGTVHQVRVEGENAFILFTPREGKASYFVMKRDAEGWKSTSIAAGVPFDPLG
jgi:hypothetical protein